MSRKKPKPVHVTKRDDVPEEPHWAILTFSSINVPGDERSRTNPGHGYGAHTVSKVDYKAFTDEYAWESEIEALEKAARDHGRHSKPYVALQVNPAKVTTIHTIKVSVEESR